MKQPATRAKIGPRPLRGEAMSHKEAIRLAKQITTLHAKSYKAYNNATCDADNARFEELALRLARGVLGLPQAKAGA